MEQVEKSSSFDEESFMRNYLALLLDYEKEMTRDPSFFGKREVEAACRLWGRITREARFPSWIPGERISEVPTGKFLKISKKHREDALHVFWIMMTSFEQIVGEKNDKNLKIIFSGWCDQWNRITGQNYKSRFNSLEIN